MRELIFEQLYEWSKIPYQKWFKANAPWDITAKTLIKYPQESLGFHLGCFLLQHDFSLEPKLENHDIFHVLTQTGISVPDEISMQFYLLGNGKKSIYLLGVITLGLLIFPDYFQKYYEAYKNGKKAHPFHHLEYLSLLDQSIYKIQESFNIQ